MHRHFSKYECIDLFDTFQFSNCLAIVEPTMQCSGITASNKTLNFPVEDT